MNLVRLGMIVALSLIAYYALTVYAGLPPERISIAPTSSTTTVTYMCPAIENSHAGIGAIIVACVALGGALGVSAVDLWRRVY